MSTIDICNQLQELTGSIENTQFARYIPAIRAAEEMLKSKSSIKKSAQISGQISLEDLM